MNVLLWTESKAHVHCRRSIAVAVFVVVIAMVVHALLDRETLFNGSRACQCLMVWCDGDTDTSSTSPQTVGPAFETMRLGGGLIGLA